MDERRKLYEEKEVKMLIKKALWDYICSDSNCFRGTDFHNGISTDWKSHKKMNIDKYWDKINKKFRDGFSIGKFIRDSGGIHNAGL